jgi:hypothetical protein
VDTIHNELVDAGLLEARDQPGNELGFVSGVARMSLYSTHTSSAAFSPAVFKYTRRTGIPRTNSTQRVMMQHPSALSPASAVATRTTG